MYGHLTLAFVTNYKHSQCVDRSPGGAETVTRSLYLVMFTPNVHYFQGGRAVVPLNRCPWIVEHYVYNI